MYRHITNGLRVYPVMLLIEPQENNLQVKCSGRCRNYRIICILGNIANKTHKKTDFYTMPPGIPMKPNHKLVSLGHL